MKEKFESLVEHLIGSGFFLEEAVEILESTLITRALSRTDGNQSAAAKLLGIHRNTLQRKILQFKITEPKVRRKPARRARQERRRLKAG